MTKITCVPWVLQDSGNSIEFRHRLHDAVQGGAKGYIAGRAFWENPVVSDEEARQLAVDWVNGLLKMARYKVDMSVLTQNSRINT